jgi:hypothetical protein
MIRDYLPKDYARCNNHACPLSSKCSRYLQIALDRRKGEDKTSTTRFTFERFRESYMSGTRCPQYIHFAAEVGG